MISCEIDVKMQCEIHVKCTRCEIHIWGKMIIRLSAFRNIFQQNYLYHFAISTREIVSKALHVGFVDNMYNAPRVRNTHDPSSLTFTCIYMYLFPRNPMRISEAVQRIWRITSVDSNVEVPSLSRTLTQTLTSNYR